MNDSRKWGIATVFFLLGLLVGYVAVWLNPQFVHNRALRLLEEENRLLTEKNKLLDAELTEIKLVLRSK